nr:hypothetical protein [uncultured Rhodopila sp.]
MVFYKSASSLIALSIALGLGLAGTPVQAQEKAIQAAPGQVQAIEAWTGDAGHTGRHLCRSAGRHVQPPVDGGLR